MKKFWVSFGVLNAVVAGTYVAQRPVDKEHICRTIGADLDLSPPAKLFNFVGTKYRSVTGKYLTNFNLEKIISSNEVDCEKEAFLLTQPWSSSPLIEKSPRELVEQQSRFVNRLNTALNHEDSPLSPLGRVLLAQSFQNYQKNRKEIIEYVFTHPECLSGDSIDSNNGVLVVVGMHRTGSTLLQNLLAQDPNTRTTRMWEMVRTIPPARSEAEILHSERAKETDKKFAQSDLVCKNWYLEFIKMHFICGNNPEEDVILLFNQFAIWYLNYLLSYADPELSDVLRESAPYLCRYLHLYLKVLNASYPVKSHWVLKNPDHCQYLPDLLKEFPEANVVVTHRDPTSVVASWAHLNLLSQHISVYNDSKEVVKGLNPKDWGQMWMRQSAEEIGRLVKDRERMKQENPKLENRILDVCYSELITDPVGVIRKIYRHFGYEFTPQYEEKIREYMQNNPKGKHGKISYSLEAFALDKETVEESFKDYIEQYSRFF